MTTDESLPNAGKPERNEWKILLVLAISYLFIEALVRCFAGSLSVDLRNTLATPETARRIARASEKSHTILVLGNSLARRGVDLAMLREDTEWQNDSTKHGIEVGQFTPDGSSVSQWDWGLKRYFLDTGAHPDVILLFTGRVHLLDSRVSPETLGAYYVGTPELSEAVKSMQGSEDAIRLLAGRTSHLLANRDRVRTRIGYSHIPGFEIAWPTLTTGNRSEPEAADRQSLAGSTESLKRLIGTARQMGSDLRVFSVPMPEPYQIPAPVLRLLEKTGTPFQGLSAVPGITPERFPDGYHLDKAGSRIFTKAILDSL